MNKTEEKAHDYLIKLYPESRVEFHAHSSPDFTVNDKGYEVKLLQGNGIRFHKGQLKHLSLMPNCYILIYDRQGYLKTTIPSSLLIGNVIKCDGVRIYNTADRRFGRTERYKRDLKILDASGEYTVPTLEELGRRFKLSPSGASRAMKRALACLKEKERVGCE